MCVLLKGQSCFWLFMEIYNKISDKLSWWSELRYLVLVTPFYCNCFFICFRKLQNKNFGMSFFFPVSFLDAWKFRLNLYKMCQMFMWIFLILIFDFVYPYMGSVFQYVPLSESCENNSKEHWSGGIRTHNLAILG